MNRPIIITAGIALILLIIGVWVYLMLFGAPKETSEVFANLGFTKEQQGTTITPPEDSPTIDALVDTKSGKLRQLTTRPVAGFMATTTKDGDVIRYAERGTGHIYEINLGSGEEKLISRTTVPQVATAVFSKDATLVALTSYQNYVTNVFVGSITEASLKGVSLEPGASNLAFTSSGDVRYSVAQNGTTIGYQQNLKTASRAEVFTFAFTNLDVAWEAGLNAVYIATKPAQNLQGFIYTIKNNMVTPATTPAYGLSALYSNNTIVTTYRDGGNMVSAAHRTTAGTVQLPLLTLKEKCAFDIANSNYLWCGAPVGTADSDYVENWYKGTRTSDDYLWLVNIEKQTAEVVASPQQIIGRALDVTNPALKSDGKAFLFKNKSDQTLWLYDLTRS